MNCHQKTMDWELPETVRISLTFMSCFLLISVSFFLLVNNAHALETQYEKESYSIGYQVGLSMKKDAVEVDFEKLVQGLQDAINAKEPLLSQDEMSQLIVGLKKKSREIQMRRIQEQIVQNAEEAEKFLAENKKKEGIQTTESGLQYRVLKEGDGMTPKPEDFAVVNYVGTFTDGKEFDNSHVKGEPAKVQVDSVIKGWTEALPMMKVGSKWKLFVPPELGYGRGGLGQKIPPNKVLVFDMELLAVEKAAQRAQTPDTQTGEPGAVREMSITGEIARGEHGYIIRGNKPAMIWTILNPNAGILDAFVKNEKVVSIEVRIVSGDNVEIKKIDGKDYS